MNTPSALRLIIEGMKRTRRQRAASKAAFALAAKLSPEQRKYRAQRAALARYDRPAFEALKAHGAECEALTEAEQAAVQIIKQALQEHWTDRLMRSNSRCVRRSDWAQRPAFRARKLGFTSTVPNASLRLSGRR